MVYNFCEPGDHCLISVRHQIDKCIFVTQYGELRMNSNPFLVKRQPLCFINAAACDEMYFPFQFSGYVSCIWAKKEQYDILEPILHQDSFPCFEVTLIWRILFWYTTLSATHIWRLSIYEIMCNHLRAVSFECFGWHIDNSIKIYIVLLSQRTCSTYPRRETLLVQPIPPIENWLRNNILRHA